MFPQYPHGLSQGKAKMVKKTKAIQTDSEFLEHIPCTNCSSSDAAAVYDDGHTHCFKCGHRTGGTAVSEPKKKTPRDLISGDFKDLVTRQIRQDTCKFLNYRVGKYKGKACQIADFFEDGQVVAQKIRLADKSFIVLGDKTKLGLYGSHKFRDGGRRIVITEGEIDCLSVSQLMGNKWPVVSVPNGAQGAKKAIAKSIDFINGFEKVIFAFDMDEPGQKAAKECAEMLKPGKAYIAHLPEKDPNECLVKGKGKELVSCLWESKAHRPDGILTFSDLREKMKLDPDVGAPWAFEDLNELTYGRRLGEIIAIGAGTGVGKTDFMTQQAVFDVNVLKEPVALYFLEQSPVDTAKRMAGKHAGKRFHVPGAGWTSGELDTAIDELEGMGNIYFYDSWGSTEWQVVRNRIEYNSQYLGVKFHYLDHLTALAAAEDSEKEALEKIMEEMASTAKRLNICIIFVSHLATPDGKPHEEGGRVMARHFKGSRAIGFWSHFMIGLERDQQSTDSQESSVTTIRILKDRFTGQSVGKTYFMGYDVETGRLFMTEKKKPNEESCPFESDGEF